MRWPACALLALLLVPTVLLALPATGSGGAPRVQEGPGPGDPLVVVAHVDVGVNPYNIDFRWDDPRAFEPPCTYLPRYPCDAVRLDLHLNEKDFATAFALDQATWLSVQPGVLYWIPGTKIVGAYAFATQGDYFVLDPVGHGTMTASRSAGNSHSLCPTCLFVSVQGLGTDEVQWAANSGFVDVQTNSWGSLLFIDPLPSLAKPIQQAAQKQPVFFASGNGLAGFDGVVGMPTLTMPTGAPDAILVGAHDNGRILTWPGTPPHVIADGYGPWMALYNSTDAVEPNPIACCTSTATPYAAGGAAALVQEARRLLGDPGGEGTTDGVLARAAPGHAVPGSGPLSDGVFTLDELKQVLFHTADLRPGEGPDDGLLHWTADPAAHVGDVAGNPVDYATNPGQNPYCLGCVSTPLPYSAVPTDVSLWANEGYGAIDPASVAQAKAVLRGDAALPARPVEDALYAADQAFREAWFFQKLPG
jgi:hypothetical protein